MKKSWQKLPAVLCAMTLALSGLSVFSCAEEMPAENPAAEEQPFIETAREASTAAEETQSVPESAAVPAAVEEPAQSPETVTAPAETPAQTEAPAVETPVQTDAVETVPSAEIDLTAETDPAEDTRDEEAPATEDTVSEESFIKEETEEVQTEEISENVTDDTSAVPEANPDAEEAFAAEEAPAPELLPVDMTVETLTEAYGVVTANRPCMIRLVSKVSGRVKITVTAGNPLYVQFGNEAGEIISEHYPDEDGNVTFSVGTESGRSVLLYVWSIGVNEDGTIIESVPFHISSEKVEHAQAEMLNEYVEPEEAVPADEFGTTEAAVPVAANAEDATENPAAVNVRRVVLSGEAGSSFKEGQTVHLSVNLEGFEDVNEFMIIWEVNHGEGWEEISRGENNFYSFPASIENLNAEYRVRVLFR